MSKITVIFTKTKWSPISFLIRWTLPRTRFALALSSHCFIVDNEDPEVLYETTLSTGVRKISKFVALREIEVVKTVTYNVPNAEAGMEFLRKQLGKKYDLKGATGLGLKPDRNWADDNKWFCYELAAGVLSASGLDIFDNLSHVNETFLMTLKT